MTLGPKDKYPKEAVEARRVDAGHWFIVCPFCKFKDLVGDAVLYTNPTDRICGRCKKLIWVWKPGEGEDANK